MTFKSIFSTDPLRIAIIDSRALERECFVRGIEVAQPDASVQAFSSVSEWIEYAEEGLSPTYILFTTEGRRMTDKTMADDVARLCASTAMPVVILSPHEEISEMIAALDGGARAYIPASMGIEATLVALRLAGAGGIFLPAKSLYDILQSVAAPDEPGAITNFTSRQAAVAEALRRGKPNKIIAYELNMCESTVKVHIRNIMKKLDARNRTEAGYKLNAMLPEARAAHL